MQVFRPRHQAVIAAGKGPRKRATAIDANELTQSIHSYYNELRSDPTAWDEELKERELWDQTLKDGKDARSEA